MKKSLLSFAIAAATFFSASATITTDVLTIESLDLTSLSATKYESFSDKSVTSDAVYAGNLKRTTNNEIQLRNTDNSCIISTQSGGNPTKVKVKWGSATSTSSNRKVIVYASENPYTSIGDLSSASTRGTKIGEITYTDASKYDTELTIPAIYKYVGITASGALYLDEIDIEWYNPRKLYITGDNYGDWGKGGNGLEMSSKDGISYNITLSSLQGAWKIWDGTWDYNFGVGSKQPQVTYLADGWSEAWFDGGNFNANYASQVTIYLEITEGSDVKDSSIPANIKIVSPEIESPVIPGDPDDPNPDTPDQPEQPEDPEPTFEFPDPTIDGTLYKLVYSADELVAGKKYVLAYYSGEGETAMAMGTTNAANVTTNSYRKAVSVTTDNYYIAATDEVTPFTINILANGNYSLKMADGNYLAITNNGTDKVAETATLGATGEFKFTYNEETHTWNIQGISSAYYLQYNTSNPRFGSYAGKMADCRLYVLASEEQGPDDPVVETEVPEALFMLGNVNGTAWSTSKGVAMKRTGNAFTIDMVTVNDAGSGLGYFSFAAGLGNDWNEINANYNRYGAVDPDQRVDAGIAEDVVAYKAPDAGICRSWSVAPGVYSVVVDFDANTMALIAPEVDGTPYRLVTTAEGLVDGAKYILAYTTEATGTGYAMGAYSSAQATSKSARTAIPVDVKDNFIGVNETEGDDAKNGVWPFTIVEQDGKYAMQLKDNMYLAINGTTTTSVCETNTITNVNLFDFTFNEESNTWTIAATAADAINMQLQFNSQNPRFSSYSGKQKDCRLYRLFEVEENTNPDTPDDPDDPQTPDDPDVEGTPYKLVSSADDLTEGYSYLIAYSTVATGQCFVMGESSAENPTTQGFRQSVEMKVESDYIGVKGNEGVVTVSIENHPEGYALLLNDGNYLGITGKTTTATAEMPELGEGAFYTLTFNDADATWAIVSTTAVSSSGKPQQLQYYTNSNRFSTYAGTQKNCRLYKSLTSGVAGVNADNDAPVEYYNLQGIRVSEPTTGIYIRRQGVKVTKILVK